MRISDWSSDVCSSDLKDPTFAQWTRAKSFDGFGALGPVIATDIDPTTFSVRTILNGDERQNYPVADMIFPPHRLVSLLSHDMTLLPGDVIACGTSIGSEEHKSEPQSLMRHSYADSCLEKTKMHT